MHKVRTIRRDFLVLPSLTSFKMSFNISLYSSNMILSPWRRTPHLFKMCSSWSCQHELKLKWHKCTSSRCSPATCVKTNKKVVYGIIMLPVCVSRFNFSISWSIFANVRMSLMSFGVPRVPLRCSPLIIIPPMLHTNLQYMALLSKGINARNLRTFHKPILCGKSVARYIKYFQLVGSQSYGSCIRDTFCISGKKKRGVCGTVGWREQIQSSVFLRRCMFPFFPSSDLHIRMLYATSRPWLRWLCGLLC